MMPLLRLVAFLLFALSGLAWAAGPGKPAIASAHPLATQAGMEVLEAGGNAFDAAVAVSAALGVAEPFASGLGGGGLWLLHFAEDGRQVVVDARETAPGEAHAAMYLDEDGEPVPGLSLNGPLAAAIPGTPAALVHVSERYGRLSLGMALAPAIRLAREGIPVYERMRLGLNFKAEQLAPLAGRRGVPARRDEVPAVVRSSGCPAWPTSWSGSSTRARRASTTARSPR
jgi:gamma-glutamyltranspeptidase / glutathione hydrolase